MTVGVGSDAVIVAPWVAFVAVFCRLRVLWFNAQLGAQGALRGMRKIRLINEISYYISVFHFGNGLVVRGGVEFRADAGQGTQCGVVG